MEIGVHDSRRDGDEERFTAYARERDEWECGVAELDVEAHGPTEAVARERITVALGALADKLRALVGAG
jgi:hypothetical protein